MDFIGWILVFFGVLFGLFAVIALVGLCLPKTHSAGRRLVLEQPVEAVWETISTIEKQPEWNEMLMSVEKLPDKNGHEVWREIYNGNYPMMLETVESDPPKKLVRAIADEKGPFSGNWTFVIEPTDSGSSLTITENGEIPNPFFRFMARMFMNPAKYIDLYMRQLAKKFGEPVVIENVTASASNV